MKYSVLTILMFFLFGCKSAKITDEKSSRPNYILSFGSCTDAYKDSLQLWKEIYNTKPNLLVLEGDMIYTKKENTTELKQAYIKQKSHPDFQKLSKTTKIEGIYDDHDYGMNDGGKNNPIKNEAKQLVLEFLEIPKSDERYTHEGLYFSRNLTDKVKLIILDTRTFRDDLLASKEKGKRYDPITNSQGTFLGKEQWKWLETELAKSKEKIILLGSTVQFINTFHSYEAWATMPHERNKMINLLSKFPKKRIIFLSGDRHFSEISKQIFDNINYPIYDITSSGFTQTYTGDFENNPLRVSTFIKERNFANILIFDENIKVQFIGAKNKIIFEQNIDF